MIAPKYNFLVTQQLRYNSTNSLASPSNAPQPCFLGINPQSHRSCQPVHQLPHGCLADAAYDASWLLFSFFKSQATIFPGTAMPRESVKYPWQFSHHFSSMWDIGAILRTAKVTGQSVIASDSTLSETAIMHQSPITKGMEAQNFSFGRGPHP
jgi:hypothetical protein